MESSLGCPHYERKCEILAPCCEIWYGCRHCHNEQYKGPKAPGCKVEKMNRTEVKKIRCLVCKELQAPSEKCVKCGEVFARYYCSKCILYDDALEKHIFHCDDCGMCRIGKKEEKTHCFTCGLCIHKAVESKHKCSEIKGVNCPVCLEPLFESIKPILLLERCLHWIHVKCLNDYGKNYKNQCPVCEISITLMSDAKIAYLDKKVEIQKERLPKGLIMKQVKIYCRDCLMKSEGVEFHVVMKCKHCGSYNTNETNQED